MIKRALISVSDKNGIAEFAKELHELGIEIVSTGGTAGLLSDEGIPVIPISDVTGFPECLDGRVKTLHPAVHGGLLAKRDEPSHMRQIQDLNIQPIDIVVVNLYPFKKTILKPDVSFEEAIENIDIGGPTMLRSAAKNFRDVIVIIDPDDYAEVLAQLKATHEVSYETRMYLAGKVFRSTAYYDTLIADYFKKIRQDDSFDEHITFAYDKAFDLRYGENPHQKAVFYKQITDTDGTLAQAQQLWGKELSYNNINDANGAIEILKDFNGEPTVVAVKHANPCGIASAEKLCDAYVRAYEADPVSIYGGIIAANEPIDAETAKKMAETFLEVVISPGYSEEALEILKGKKNIRLLQIEHLDRSHYGRESKKVLGGLLVQDRDESLHNELTCVTKRKPTAEETEQLLFALKAVKNTKSNAISLVKNKTLIGNGPGQTSRIWALENAIRQSNVDTVGSVMASDAFFPFDDCVRTAAAAGITAIIQPGGGIRDELSIAACDELGIAMIFTGMRHFKHS